MREKSSPRPNCQRRCEEMDFDWHSLGGRYWDESVRYRFNLSEIEEIEKATEDLHAMCMQLVGDLISKGDYGFLGIPEKTLRHVVPAVEASWRRRDPTFYGRFDFGIVVNLDGSLGVKMYEYNADTPTSLYEAAVVQWCWLKDIGLSDQFNSLEEKMDGFFLTKVRADHIHFLTQQDCGPEDAGTVGYIAERAHSVGKGVSSLHTFSISRTRRL
jgi:glutathionylspermidine synthase